MPRALVLCGGGSLGSYELGAWRALREAGIKFDIVTGTSIGGIMSAFVATDDYAHCENLWHSVEVQDVLKDGFSINKDWLKESRNLQARQLMLFAKSYVAHRGADISPFIDLMDRSIDYEKVSKSKIKAACVMTSYPDLKEVDVHLNGLEPEKIRDCLIATSACFPIFPVHSFDGRKWIDGGFTNNLPIDLAIKMGATEIYAVALPSIPKVPQHHELTRLPFVTLIEPRHEIGTIMDFSRKRLDENEILGYLDARKVLKLNKGFDYYFHVRESEKKMADRFTHNLLKKDPYSIEKLNKALGLEQGKKHHSTAYLIKTIELMAKTMGINNLKEYSVKEIDYLLHARLEDELWGKEEGANFEEKRLTAHNMKWFMLSTYGARKRHKSPTFHPDLFKNSPEAAAIALVIKTIARQKIGE